MHGFPGGMHARGDIHGQGGHEWQRGACVVKGGMHGKEGACVAKGVHAWQRGGVHGKGGACMAKGGHAWRRVACVVCTHTPPPSTRYGRSKQMVTQRNIFDCRSYLKGHRSPNYFHSKNVRTKEHKAYNCNAKTNFCEDFDNDRNE